MVEVKDFGAVGDGETDDSNAIQRAFDESEGAVCFSAGTYLIQRPIEVAPCRPQRLPWHEVPAPVRRRPSPSPAVVRSR